MTIIIYPRIKHKFSSSQVWHFKSFQKKTQINKSFYCIKRKKMILYEYQ